MVQSVSNVLSAPATEKLVCLTPVDSTTYGGSPRFSVAKTVPAKQNTDAQISTTRFTTDFSTSEISRGFKTEVVVYTLRLDPMNSYKPDFKDI